MTAPEKQSGISAFLRRRRAARGRRAEARVAARTTVLEACMTWLQGVEAGRIPARSGKPYRPSTVRGYRRSIVTYIGPALGHVRLVDVRRADLQDFVDALLAQGLAPSTIRNIVAPISVVVGRAVRRDELPADPTSGLELPVARGRRDRVAGPAEAAALLDALSHAGLHLERALWATALHAGPRRGELRGLQWIDVDLDARELHVSRSWDDVEGEQAGGKSAAADRTIPISSLLSRELAGWKLRSGRSGAALVFGRTATDAFLPASVRRRALRAWKAAGLEPLGLHPARHTYISWLAAAGVPVKSAQEWAGHSSPMMTLGIYTHSMPGAREAGRAQLDAYLGEPLPQLRAIATHVGSSA